MPPPDTPKIYHIVHVDRLASILADDFLWCDGVMAGRANTGTTIGMDQIKRRRLNELLLASHPDLHVGECVPFNFCPRSVMLYLIWKANHQNLAYRGGQHPIVHLEADLRATVAWATGQGLRWAFTLSNAGARFFEDRCDLDRLDELNWEAIGTRTWSGSGIPQSVREGKQAEFLVEHRFPWTLVERTGVLSQDVARLTLTALQGLPHRPRVEVIPDWYY